MACSSFVDHKTEEETRRWILKPFMAMFLVLLQGVHHIELFYIPIFQYDKHIWVWVKIRYPNNWMVNTKLD